MQEQIYSQTSPEKNQLPNEFFLFIWEIIKISIIALLIIIPIRYFIAQPFFVKGASMEPSYKDGDYLIVDELSYRFTNPKRGDVIVFRFPRDPHQFFIKRIIGLPEETIEIKDNKIIIYNQSHPLGFILDESEYLSPNQKTKGYLKIKLDDNEYFVMGDNRLQSSDSRRWGPLNKTYIIGKTFIRAWPFNRVARFTPVPYPSPLPISK